MTFGNWFPILLWILLGIGVIGSIFNLESRVERLESAARKAGLLGDERD